MIQHMDRITDKQGWEEDVYKKEITTMWRAGLTGLLKRDLGENDADITNEDEEKQESTPVLPNMMDWVRLFPFLFLLTVVYSIDFPGLLLVELF